MPTLCLAPPRGPARFLRRSAPARDTPPPSTPSSLWYRCCRAASSRGRRPRWHRVAAALLHRRALVTVRVCPPARGDADVAALQGCRHRCPARARRRRSGLRCRCTHPSERLLRTPTAPIRRLPAGSGARHGPALARSAQRTSGKRPTTLYRHNPSERGYRFLSPTAGGRLSRQNDRSAYELEVGEKRAMACPSHSPSPFSTHNGENEAVMGGRRAAIQRAGA